jgi:hypothetical protein
VGFQPSGNLLGDVLPSPKSLENRVKDKLVKTRVKAMKRAQSDERGILRQRHDEQRTEARDSK